VCMRTTAAFHRAWRAEWQCALWLWVWLACETPNSAGELGPIVRGSWPGYARGPAETVAVSGNYACLASVDHGLDLIDVSDPTNPRWLGGDSSYQYLGGVVFSNGLILAAAGMDGLIVLEVPGWRPSFKSASLEGGQLHLSWEGASGTKLPVASRLGDPDWQDVGGSAGTNQVSLPTTAAAGFFRLVRP
jgi:hypothetical protein